MLKKMCCMRLRTAGMVIGWVSVVACILGILVFSVLLVNCWTDDNTPTQFKHGNSRNEEMIMEYSIIVICFLIQMLFSGFLIRGSSKSSHLMLVPWMILMGLTIVYMILCTFGDIFAIYDNHSIARQLAVGLASKALLLILTIWSYLVVYSLYKRIKYEKQNVSTHVPGNPPVQHKLTNLKV